MRAAIVWPICAIAPMVPIGIGWYAAKVDGLEWYHLYAVFVVLTIVAGVVFDRKFRTPDDRAKPTTKEKP